MEPVLTSRSKRVVALALVAVLIGGTAGVTALVAPNAASDDVSGATVQEDATTVRVVHASPNTPPVNVSIDGETVLANLSYGNVSEYFIVSQGLHNVTITSANDSDTVLFETRVRIGTSGTFTLGVVGDGTAPVIFADDPPVVDDEAAVRLAHMAPDAGTVDVTVEETGDVLYDNVSFGTATEYETVPAGNYTLEVRNATESGDGDVIATVNVTLEAGTASSAFAIPTNESVEAPIRIVLGNDSVAEAETGTATETAGTGTATETANGTETGTGSS